MDQTTPREKQEVSIGLLAALVSPESEAFDAPLRRLGWKEQTVNPGLSAANIKHWRKVISGTPANIYTGAIGEAGQAVAAVETFVFLERTKPSIVYLCGIAGSLNKEKFPKKDVIIAKKVLWKTQDKIEDGPSCGVSLPCRRYRPKEHRVPAFDVDVLKKLEASVARQKKSGGHLEDAEFGIHVEDVYTWNYVASGQQVTKQILENNPSAACVEMESGGFLASFERFQKVRGERPMLCFVVRGISDYTEMKDNESQARALASRNAAFVSAVLAEDAFDPNGSNFLANLLEVRTE